MASRKFEMHHRPKRKPFLDIPEIRILIDNDFYTAPNHDNSQQHICAWLLGLFCGVRPGSIAQSRNRREFLCWGDIQIIRQEEANCLFRVEVEFKVWKGWQDDYRDSYFPQAKPHSSQ